MKYLIGILLTVLSLQAFGALLYEQDFEGATTLSARSGIDLIRASCFSNPPDAFNSVELSTNHARNGTQSIRHETPGDIKCGAENRSRNEIIYARGLTGLDDINGDTAMGSEFWLGYSVYFPSDEGTNWWNNSQMFYLAQVFTKNATNGGSPEISVIKKPGGNLYIHNDWSDDPTREIVTPVKYSATVSQNTWNDVVIHWKRAYDGTGIFQMWVNDVPIADYTGPTAIRIFDRMYVKIGFYFSTSIVNHRYVMYYDDIKIGGSNSSKAEVEPGATIGLCDPVDCPNSIDTVNGGTAVPTATLIPFTATTTESVTGCQIGGGAEQYVNWDYATNTGGQFNTGDLSGLTASTQNLKCYFLPHLPAIDMSDGAWTISSSSVEKTAFDSSRYGYTSGLVLKKVSGTYSEVRQALGTAVPSLAGDNLSFDFTYSCVSPDCTNLYFTVENEGIIGYPRIDAIGTAGDLTIDFLGSDYGTNSTVTNRTLGDDVYRVSISFQANVPSNAYKIRAGFKNGAVDQEMTLHEVIVRKNWTTSFAEKSIVVGVTDTDSPTIDCTMTNTQRIIEGDYEAAISCTTDEIGGTAYAMIKTNNTPPADAAEVQAGTGSIWASNYAPDSADIEFLANGMSYQDLWGWIVHCDAVTPTPNCSTVTGVTFDDGLNPGEVKKIKFSSATKRLRTNGVLFNCHTGMEIPCSIDSFKLYDTYPWLDANATQYLEANTIEVENGGFELIEGDLVSGSINALALATDYKYVLYDTDSRPFSFGTIQLTAE